MTDIFNAPDGSPYDVCPDGTQLGPRQSCNEQPQNPGASPPIPGANLTCGPGEHPVYDAANPNGGCAPIVPTQGNGFDFGDFQMPGYDWSNFNFNPGDAPDFHAPQFSAPTAQSVLSEPGYQFRLSQGTNALEHSAAGRGVLRTGGTLKGINEYGQGFASNEYGNAFNRALQSYDRTYQGAKDEYAPKLITYSTKAQAGQRNQESAAAERWRKYLADLNFQQFIIGQGN